MDKNALKVQALLEKISSLVAQYENQCADLRVEVTLLSNERDALVEELKSLRESLVLTEESAEEQPVVPDRAESDAPVGERPEDFDK